MILAWGHLWTSGVRDVERLESEARSAAQRLLECYFRSVRTDWHWFESSLTYANAVLPHALFVAAQHWPEKGFLKVAEASFAFLDRATTAQNVFWPIGNADWYPRGERKSLYDQQPVEAAMMSDAALAAFGQTRDDRYLTIFCRAHDWFHGRNSGQEPLADFQSGACFDGLERSGVNRNQGAESTLAFLFAEVHNGEMQLAVNDTLEATAAAQDTESIPDTRPVLIGHSDSVALHR